jgi:hypothetical protein
VRVTAALAEPLTPVAVTETVGEPGIVAGAVYSPVALTVPAEAVQLVAPTEVNCCVCPRTTVAAAGEMACELVAASVTAAVADPLGPVAVTKKGFWGGAETDGEIGPYRHHAAPFWHRA